MVNRKNALSGTGSAVIFNIVHGSFVDGYGVRTTIFLKGCPLKCSWCCNPEGQRLLPEIKFTAEKCDSCGRCMEICPVQAIAENHENCEMKIRIDRELCNNCGRCIDMCCTGALEYFGSHITVEEAFNILKKDERYYNSSGGGVSIGGGEPTFQPEFTYALMKRCQDACIDVAIDTCGYTVNKLGFKILEEADLLLYDIKGIDIVKHQKNTGVSNDLILSNLERLSAMGKPIIIRLPLIPGCNDSEEDINRVAEFLSEKRSVQRIDLLPYHNFGTVKYIQLGKDYKLSALRPHPDEYIDKIKNIFMNLGIKTQIGG